MINLALDKARLTDMTYTLLTLTLYQFKDKVKVKVLGSQNKTVSHLSLIFCREMHSVPNMLHIE